ncbi:hypothetical protein G4D82_10495 [Flavobacterium sp. CYK-4]|uniref:hypothetical protein n=1 Tax=Flavobacterium lotistagni TaxID=2709660 RepID=UPI00140CCE02|nr:hypothetical protein [Flavobacterium lotistagni]NHM07652.1 hypothetical protein [Flavobacterium lotistagni]
MAAIKSDNQLNAMINRNFVIKVSEIIGEYWWPVDDDFIDFQLLPLFSDSKLTTAKKLSNFVDDEMKNRLFEKALNGKNLKYMFKIRKRLIIEFHGK